MTWQQTSDIGSHKFQCSWCNSTVATSSGYVDSGTFRRVYICPHCNQPTYFNGAFQSPDTSYGGEVKNLPDDVAALYIEARNCTKTSCYTASVLICHKLLMNIAVNHGATPGGSFISYVEHLSNTGFVPPNGKGWVDHIRKKGNEATHEIALMSRSDAEDLISFAEMLLKFIYEFPSRIPNPKP